MNETKFTPGPWKLHPKKEYIFSFKRLDDWENPRPICIPTIISNENEENEANAHLITAAPTMYEVLDWLDRKGGLGLEVHAVISTALAQARGEA